MLNPQIKKECLYYLALGNFKLGNYMEARQFNNSLLELEPNNMQGHSLEKLIENKISQGEFGYAWTLRLLY